MEKYPPYQSIFAKMSYGESQMLDKAFYEEEVKRLCLAFEQQVSISETKQPKFLSKLCLMHIYGLWEQTHGWTWLHLALIGVAFNILVDSHTQFH